MTGYSVPRISPTTRRAGALAGAIGAALVTTARWLRAYRSGRQLLRLHALDDRILADIGLDRGDIQEAYFRRWSEDPAPILEHARSERLHSARLRRRHGAEVPEP